MDITSITQLITSVGFPICMCLIMAYYIKYITDSHTEESKNLNDAIVELKIAITELINKLEKE